MLYQFDKKIKLNAFKKSNIRKRDICTHYKEFTDYKHSSIIYYETVRKHFFESGYLM